MKKFSELLQENLERQLNGLRINEQKNFTEEILKKSQTNSGAEQLTK